MLTHRTVSATKMQVGVVDSQQESKKFSLENEGEIQLKSKEPFHEYRTGLTSDEVPQFMRHPYILSGYRLGGDTRRCILSLFELHNETMNCWTMIGSAMCSLSALIYTLVSHPGVD